MYVISPWSKGGWVNSQVFDHTSVIRFIERRFGVMEPNISKWRRAVCGDLTTAFNFNDPDNREFLKKFPDTVAMAKRAHVLQKRTTPPTPTKITMPIQAKGTKPACALPYELHTTAHVLSDEIELTFNNTGSVGAVFHVYDRKNLDKVPHRYTVEAKKQLKGKWELTSDKNYDLWILGPNGFHRHFMGDASGYEKDPLPEVSVLYDTLNNNISLKLTNNAKTVFNYTIMDNGYFEKKSWKGTLKATSTIEQKYSLDSSANWYDFTITLKDIHGYSRRFAGHMETGKTSISDPLLGGIAIAEQSQV